MANFVILRDLSKGMRQSTSTSVIALVAFLLKAEQKLYFCSSLGAQNFKFSQLKELVVSRVNYCITLSDWWKIVSSAIETFECISLSHINKMPIKPQSDTHLKTTEKWFYWGEMTKSANNFLRADFILPSPSRVLPRAFAASCLNTKY